MNDKELLNIWKSYDQKLEEVLSINKKIIGKITKSRLNQTIDKLKRPKQMMLVIGIPYTLFLYIITFIGFNAGGLFVMIGFGGISIIMTGVIISYIYHLYLIKQIKSSDDVIFVQTQISKLKISSFNVARITIIQLPFWSICWMSLQASKNSLLIYGGVNILVFLGLSWVAHWMYTRLDIQNRKSKINQIFFSGSEWNPILKASDMLAQIKEYQN